MQAAVLEKPIATGALDADRLRAVVLVRIASAGRGLAKAELADDLAPLTSHRIPAARWRALLDLEIDALAAAGLIAAAGSRIEASDGRRGARRHLPRPQGQPAAIRGRRLQRTPGRQGAGAGARGRQTPRRAGDGRRPARGDRAKGLRPQDQGRASPSRLRAALAAVALARAFGNKFKAELAGKTGFSPKAGRLLAASSPRSRATSAPTAASSPPSPPSASALRNPGWGPCAWAVLRRYLDGPESRPRQRGARRKGPLAAAAPGRARASTAAPWGRPDLAGFAQEVRRHAGDKAQGWPGNRKAYIGHVWHTCARGGPSGASARSSSNACSPRRIAPAAWRSPTPT